jgi:hypothetical protein
MQVRRIRGYWRLFGVDEMAKHSSELTQPSEFTQRPTSGWSASPKTQLRNALSLLWLGKNCQDPFGDLRRTIVATEID